LQPGEDLLFEKTLQTSPGKTLDVDALAGNVTLTAGGNIILDYYGSNYGVILNSESGNINLDLLWILKLI
jgi:hypothetical protein